MSAFNEAQLREIRNAFDVFDKDHSGNISRAELAEVMKSLGQNPTSEELDDVIKEVDLDNDGSIGFNEFVKMMEVELQRSDKALIDAFKVLDENGDGFVTLQELKRIVIVTCPQITDDELKQMIDDLDTDKDGKINYEEFINAMQS